jgi:hypothetical protein
LCVVNNSPFGPDGELVSYRHEQSNAHHFL